MIVNSIEQFAHLVLGDLKSFLPVGASFGLKNNKKGCVKKYRFVRLSEAGKWLLMPSSSTLAKPLLRNLFTGQLADLNSFEDWLKELPGLDIYLDNIQQNPWQGEEQFSNTEIVAISASNKVLVFFCDTEKKEPVYLYKLAQQGPVGVGLLREQKVLKYFNQQGKNISPKSLDVAEPVSFDGVITRQTFEFGDHPVPQVDIQQVFVLVEHLQLQGKSIVLKNYSNFLRQRVEKINASLETRQRLSQLLEGVNSQARCKAAIFHGDFRSRNLLRMSNGVLKAIDWEFSFGVVPSYFDLVRLILDDAYNNKNVETFEAQFQGKLPVIEQLTAQMFIGVRPAIEELLLVQFCQHFIDRVIGFGGVQGGNLARLEKVLHSDFIS